MLVLVGCFSYTPHASFSKVSSYTLHANFSEVFLLHT